MNGPKSDLSKITPPRELSDAAKLAILEHATRRLASYRNKAELYAQAEAFFAPSKRASKTPDVFIQEIEKWANEMLRDLWTACQEVGSE